MAAEDDDGHRAAIDAEIYQLRLRISALSSTRNSLAPIARLPPELMSIIFLYARNISAWRYKSKMAIKISWICRDWRRISLDCPRLWSEIDLQHLSGIHEFLWRSRQIPLTITLKSINYKNPPLNNIMDTAYASRIESLDLSSENFDELRPRHVDLEPIYFNSTPALKVLSLHGTTFPNVLVAHPPPLHQLKLTYCDFEWDFAPFSILTTLCIENPTITVSLESLLPALAKTPLLTELTLVKVLSQPVLEDSDLSQVKLPELKKLNITDDTLEQVQAFVDHLRVSSDAFITVIVSTWLVNQDPTTLLQAIHNSRSRSAAPITALNTFERDGFSGIHFCEESPDENPVQTLLGIQSYYAESAIRLALKRLDLQFLEELKVSRIRNNEPFHSFYPSSWPKDVGKLSKLRMLIVDQDAAYTFLGFLRDEAREIKRTLENNERRRERIEEENMKTPAEREATRKELLAWLGEDSPWAQSLKEPAEPEEYVPDPIQLSFMALKQVSLTFPKPKDDEEDAEGEDFAEDRVDEENILYNLRTRLSEGVTLDRLEFSHWPISDETLDELEDLVPMVIIGDDI